MTRPACLVGSSRAAREPEPLRRLPLLRAECIGDRHLEPEFAQGFDKRQEPLALVLGVCRRIIGELCDAHGVVLGVPGSGSAKCFELCGREVDGAGG